MKAFRTFLFLVLPCLLLVGCAKGNFHVTVHWDGSATYQAKILTSPLLTEGLQPVKERLLAEGYQIDPIEEGGKKGWLATKEVARITEDPPGRHWLDTLNAEGKSASLNLFLEDQKKGPIAITNHLLTTDIAYENEIDLSRLDPENALGQAFVDELDLDITLTLPLKADHHNANTLSEDGKTLTWKLKPGEINKIFLQVQIPNPVGIGIGCLLFVILLCMFSVFWFLRARRKKAVKK